MSFLFSSMTGVEAARMNAMGWRLGDIEGAFLELMVILISFQNVSIDVFRHECRGQEGGYIQLSQIMS